VDYPHQELRHAGGKTRAFLIGNTKPLFSHEQKSSFGGRPFENGCWFGHAALPHTKARQVDETENQTHEFIIKKLTMRHVAGRKSRNGTVFKPLVQNRSSGVTSSKFFTLGEKQYFVWDVASQSTK